MIDLKIIQDEVEKYYEFEIDFKTRKMEHVYARCLCYYMARNFTNCSLSVIGKYYGKRHHCTVLHGFNQCEIYCQDVKFRRAKAKLLLIISEYFENVDWFELQEAKKYDELSKTLAFYKGLYKKEKKKNERLTLIMKSKGLTDIDRLISHLEPKELKELKQYRVIPFLRMRGKFNTQEL